MRVNEGHCMNEYELYRRVEQEMRDGIIDQDLWRQSLEDQNGDEISAKERYIEYRIAEFIQEQLNKNEYEFSSNESYDNPKHNYKSVKKRNIIIGISLLALLFILVILLGLLLHRYFN